MAMFGSFVDELLGSLECHPECLADIPQGKPEGMQPLSRLPG
jgi:hypothetical protein